MTSDAAREPYQDYYKKVELHWSLARGNQIIVSPLEFMAIEKWYEGGVPLAVVLRAIDIFIEKKKKAKRQRNFLLTHVEGTVKKCSEEYTALHVGEGEEADVKKCSEEYTALHVGEGEEADLLGSKIKGLVRKLHKLAKAEPEASDLVDGLVAALEAVNTDGIVQYDDLDAQVQGLETRMIDWFRQSMDPRILDDIKAEIAEFMEEDEDPEFFARMVNDGVRAHFTLPRLTLLG